METSKEPTRRSLQSTAKDSAAIEAPRPATADEEAVARVLAGDRDAFSGLVERHHRPIYHYIYRMVGSADLAADLTQEVFLKVYTALSSFDPSYRFTTWLYRIASNRVIDHVRRRHMVLVPLDPGSGDDRPAARREPAGDDRSAESRLMDRESASDVAAAIRDLPAEYRDLIVLRHFQHRSYEEIASMKDRPLGTVKNRLFRAREALRRRMER